MKQAADRTTTSTGGGTSHRSSKAPQPSNPRQAFVMAALNMSWQLAIVVLVPILGGFALDEHFNDLPLWTGVGFVLAMIGMALVVWRQLQLFSPKVTKADIERAKKLRDQEKEEDDQ